MSDLNIYQKIDAEKTAARTNQFEKEVQALPIGYVAGFATKIENGRVKIYSGVCNYRGKRIDIPYVSFVAGENWGETPVGNKLYYVYLSIDRKFYVYPAQPVWDALYRNWYHPDTNYLYIATIIIRATSPLTCEIYQHFYEWRANLVLGEGMSNDRDTYIRFISDDTNTNESFSILRNAGVNGEAVITNHGLGNLTITSDGGVTIAGNDDITISATGDITLSPSGNTDFTTPIRAVLEENTFHNYIINGDMAIAQRGTSLVGTGYLIDRWIAEVVGDTLTVTQQAFSPLISTIPGEPKNYVRAVVAHVDGAGNVSQFAHRIESVRTLAGKTATFSFWAKADAPKNVVITPSQYFGAGGSANVVLSPTTVALTASWALYSVTYAIPSVAGKTITTNDRLTFAFWLSAGSTYDAQCNTLGQQDITFEMTNVMLNPGSVAAPFRLCGGTPAQEEALCKRYCRGVTTTVAYEAIGSGISGTTDGYILIPLDTEMLAPPTLSATATDWKVGDLTTIDSDITGLSISTSRTSTKLAVLIFTGASGLTSGRWVYMHDDGTTGRKLLLLAEL